MIEKRDIQTIVKEAAERYGLNYDANQKAPTVILSDGSIKEISKDDFLKAVGKGVQSEEDVIG